MAGKHFRDDNTEQSYTAEQNTRPKAAQTPAPDAYEDLYSYEEPRGARRGTRRPTVRTPEYIPVKKKKPSKTVPITAVLCLLAAAGILFYMLWDLGIISMLLSIVH
ncbi:MAG: hypothetical protein J6I98_08695 [Clostridia bacterium]|nr:hypothetical protein [Clostridia bacterium]